ncbi:Ribosomal RNA small subunit methyltransferase H [Buchnera aphidicola (Pterocallis alni)]|uniref:16S rRNA (cytosine(1402)-N(4))-methyltransferase RsmH n=1 Tax=Buchnera aphidicola TaxID=9 RepID=UPI0034639A38
MHNQLHQTILLEESIQSLNIKKNGIYIDCTFGYGGHSHKILDKLGKKGKLYAIDQDPCSVKIAKKIVDCRFTIIHENFSNIDTICKTYNIKKKIDGIIVDLGVSTMQLMSKHRGFSFNVNGPLDMRMNPQKGISATEWIKKSNTKTIYNVLKYFGEEKFAKKIALSITKQKSIKPITTTQELAQIIYKNTTQKKQSKNPATKSFQAIRIFINQELHAITMFLKKILKILNNKSRISIISFHSLEDRIIKNFMNQYSKKPIIPTGIPISEKKIHKMYKKKLKIFNKIKPQYQEIQKNPKSRSAILRTAEFQK